MDVIVYSFLCLASYVDIKKREIPHSVIIGIGVISLFHIHPFGWMVMLPFLLAAILTKESGIGGGDVKLIGVIGLYFGFFETLLSCIVALLVSLLFIAMNQMLGKQKTKTVPLAPFITIGCALIQIIH